MHEAFEVTHVVEAGFHGMSQIEQKHLFQILCSELEATEGTALSKPKLEDRFGHNLLKLEISEKGGELVCYSDGVVFALNENSPLSGQGGIETNVEHLKAPVSTFLKLCRSSFKSRCDSRISKMKDSRVQLFFLKNSDSTGRRAFLQKLGEDEVREAPGHSFGNKIILIEGPPDFDYISGIALAFLVFWQLEAWLEEIQINWATMTEIRNLGKDVNRSKFLRDETERITRRGLSRKIELNELRMLIHRRLHLVESLGFKDTKYRKMLEDKYEEVLAEMDLISIRNDEFTAYAQTVGKYLEGLQQDSRADQLYLLQIIFLMGVLASLLALGAMPGAELITMDTNGEVLARTELNSFRWQTFLTFALPIILGSFALFFAIRKTYDVFVGRAAPLFFANKKRRTQHDFDL